MGARASGSRAAEQGQGQGPREPGVDRQERERRYWARELHDETLQGLVGLRMLLGAARQQPDLDRVLDAIDTALEMVTDEIHKLRHLIVDLRPAELDEIGLEAAIHKLAARVATLGGPKVNTDLELEYEVGTSATRLTPQIETTVYRIVQEALTNAVKHAAARSVDVRVTDQNGQVQARISDDGRGFDETSGEGKLGLVGMRERASLAGGRLSIVTSASGTTIEFVAPVARAQRG
jgi:two-component system, NarL family, sensor histidine kinase DevS